MSVSRLSPSTTPAKVRAAVQKDGYAFIETWEPSKTSEQVARVLGVPLDIEALLPGSGIPLVQSLAPRAETSSSTHRYSGRYGLNEFPLHTDLAHWYRPPRYFILRCVTGSPDVITRVLPSGRVFMVFSRDMFRRALFRPQSRHRSGAAPLLLEGSLPVDGGIRWDPAFLTPMNAAAHTLAARLQETARYQSNLLKVPLANRGDTLVVDNWRALHGRSAVQPSKTDRRIERVYLSDLSK